MRLQIRASDGKKMRLQIRASDGKVLADHPLTGVWTPMDEGFGNVETIDVPVLQAGVIVDGLWVNNHGKATAIVSITISNRNVYEGQIIRFAPGQLKIR